MRRSSDLLQDLGRDRSGASTVMVGLGAVVLLGAAGLATDVAGWYAARRDAQHAADSAAYSAATAMVAGGADLQDQGRAVAAAYGMKNGVDGVTVTVNQLSGAQGPQVEVIVERPARRFFSRLFMTEARTIRASAVAQVGAAADGCVLALNRTAPASANLEGAAGVTLDGCALMANSTSTAGLSLTGASSLSAQRIVLGASAYSKTIATRVEAVKGVTYNSAPIADPYAGFTPPVPTACHYNGRQVLNVETVKFPNDGVTPRVFCNGLKIDGATQVMFEPGIYIIDRGVLSIAGASRVQASNVTFILTSSTGANYATADVDGASSIVIEAPTTGPTAGIAIMQTRAAPPTGAPVMLEGASALSVRGAIYFPNQHIHYAGAASKSGCLVLVADKVTFTGAAGFALKCSGLGVTPAGGASTVLVR